MEAIGGTPMKIFVAGATGAVGARLVPMLVESGHAVVAMTTSPAKAERLRTVGAEPVIADGLDRDAAVAAVREAAPEVVVNQMSALSEATDLKHFDREFALTNRLRTEGNDHLLEAALACGARRFITQSFGNWNYERTGDGPKTEDDPLDPDPPANQRESVAAMRHLEAVVMEAPDIEGVVLRYGNFYGPGTSYAEDGLLTQMLRKRRLPIIGDGTGIWSFIHLEDAAMATLLMVDRGAPGIYNVADDEPAAVRDWIPELARAVGAKPPWHVPVWVGRLAVGEVGVSLMTRIRGASNKKIKAELGWQPEFPSYRDGFHAGLEEGSSVRRPGVRPS
jgi:nucleoside-diphosphate-sugar epimerase